MDEATLLVALPIAIAALNLVLARAIAAARASSRAKVVSMLVLIALTVGAWIVAAAPYLIGLADSAASCSGQPGYPGCRKYEELSALWPQTLGNLTYLLLLLLLDVAILLVARSTVRREGLRA